jgi:hypothetical protein
LRTLDTWCRKTGIKKHITWHSARLSFSILLQDANVDTATVALLLGQTSTKYVNEVYKRHRPKDQRENIAKLPTVEPYWLNPKPAITEGQLHPTLVCCDGVGWNRLDTDIFNLFGFEVAATGSAARPIDNCEGSVDCPGINRSWREPKITFFS